MLGLLQSAERAHPGGLRRAPGAGPMGPFITVPIADGRAAALGGPAPGMGMRGRGGMGMRGRGGRGGFAGAGGGGGAFMGSAREYYDLDAPENQRSVLDYGDL